MDNHGGLPTEDVWEKICVIKLIKIRLNEVVCYVALKSITGYKWANIFPIIN